MYYIYFHANIVRKTYKITSIMFSFCSEMLLTIGTQRKSKAYQILTHKNKFLKYDKNAQLDHKHYFFLDDAISPLSLPILEKGALWLPYKKLNYFEDENTSTFGATSFAMYVGLILTGLYDPVALKSQLFS